MDLRGRDDESEELTEDGRMMPTEAEESIFCPVDRSSFCCCRFASHGARSYSISAPPGDLSYPRLRKGALMKVLGSAGSRCHLSKDE